MNLFHQCWFPSEKRTNQEPEDRLWQGGQHVGSALTHHRLFSIVAYPVKAEKWFIHGHILIALTRAEPQGG